MLSGKNRCVIIMQKNLEFDGPIRSGTDPDSPLVHILLDRLWAHMRMEWNNKRLES